MNQHTDEQSREAARARMFDVELLATMEATHEAAAHETSTHKKATHERVTFKHHSPDRTSARHRSHTTPLLAAAVALVGLTVTVLIAWQQSQQLALTQDPAAPTAMMPPCAFITKPQDLVTMLPAGQQNLGVWSQAIENYESLTVFTDLRRLMILGPGVPDPTASTLLPIGKLRQLEELELPLQTDLLPVHLRALANATKVQSLRLHCKRPITPADIQALKLMPQLRVLILHEGAIDAATIRSLSELSHLDELSLQGVAGCTEEVLVQLRTVHRLRRLALSSIGEQPIVEQLGSSPTPGDGLTLLVAKALAELPLLEELKLASCKLTTAAIAALPIGLRSIQIVRCPDLVPDQLLALRHCRNLTRLSFDSHDVTHWVRAMPQDFAVKPANTSEAHAELIRELPLLRLDYYQTMPNIVRLAVAGKQSLAHVKLVWYEREDIEALASLKNLQHLTLSEQTRNDLSCLKALRRCRSLKTLTLTHQDWQLAEVEALLPGVKVLTNWR